MYVQKLLTLVYARPKINAFWRKIVLFYRCIFCFFLCLFLVHTKFFVHREIKTIKNMTSFISERKKNCASNLIAERLKLTFWAVVSTNWWMVQKCQNVWWRISWKWWIKKFISLFVQCDLVSYEREYFLIERELVTFFDLFQTLLIQMSREKFLCFEKL